MADEKTCPHCGKPVPPTALGGICPECMLKAGLASQTEGPGAIGPQGTKVVQPPPSPAEIASLFPQLEILECLGRGGMGVVYKARQPRLNRLVALKILARDKEQDGQFAERFTREAQTLARLNHPNIVTVHDFGEAGGHCYLVMEFVDGLNLRQLLLAGKMPSEKALTIVPKICDALQYAHEQGIVHRDIKPENILLDKQGRVKIADFGIAKILGQGPKDMSLTGARDVVGTPHYMAPEQVEKPLTVDHRADIYSLGVVFYEMLTGELPLGKFQPPSAKVQIDVRLDEVVLHALEKEPDRRYQQVSEVKTRLETIANTSATAAVSAAAAEEILARDYTLNIRHCLRRGWALVRNDFWPLVGMSAFVVVVLSAASSSGAVVSDGKSSGTTSILGILLSGPFMGGLYLYFLKKIRREAAGVETAFTGFRHPFPHLVMAGFLASLLTTLGFLCLILPGIYLFVAWIFTFPLIVDRRLDFWLAMQLSRKIISRHWWKFLGFLLVLALVNLVGIAACCIGLFITFPVTFAALAYAYEDILGAVKIPAGSSSFIPPIASPTPPASQPDRFGRRFAVVMACVVLISVAIAIIGILAAITIPNFIKSRNQAIAHRQEQTALPGVTNPPPASVETWSPQPAPGERPDPDKVLKEARELIQRNYYEESLQRFIWYHNHAAEFSTNLTSGWLINALSDWVELGRRYPKARQALIEIRDHKDQEFREGRGYFDLFMEVNNINDYLQCPDDTCALFIFIEQSDPALARQCYIVADDALVNRHEYARCLKYIGDGPASFDWIRQNWEREKQWRQRMNQNLTEAYQRMGRTNLFAESPEMSKSSDNQFVGQTCQLIEILVGAGHQAEAEKIRDQAVALLDDPRLKSAVSDAEQRVRQTPAPSRSTSPPATARFITRLTQTITPASVATGTNSNEPPASAELWSPPGFDRKSGPDKSNSREGVIDPATGLPASPGDILRKMLDEARELTRRHQYEEALQRYIWYHNHALEYDPSQSGVRLSSALSDWTELGRRYPRAKQALIEIRDRKTREFAQDRGYHDLFSDVSNINRELQDDEATYALFMHIRKSDAALAGECYFAAEDLLVRRGEFELCLGYIGNPQKKFESLRDSWQRMTSMDQRMAETYQRFAGTNSSLPPHAPPKDADQYFVSQTCRLIEILVGANRRAEAEKIQAQAISVLDDSRLKSAVNDAERKIGK